MTILITGGCGFLGTNIALAAIKQKYKVICFDSFKREKSKENIPIIKNQGGIIVKGDVRRKSDLNYLPNIDAIIHLAANTGVLWSIENPVYDFEANIFGTVNVLELARKQGNIPFIYASTSKVYSDLLNTLPHKQYALRYEYSFTKHEIYNGISPKGINENFPIDGFGKYPHSPYGISKLSGDLYSQEYFHVYNIPMVVNRMGCIYGYFQKGVLEQGWLDHFLRKIAFGDRKITIYGNGKQVRDLLWGEDVARLYLLQLRNINKVKGNVFNVGGGISNTLSLLEAVKIIEDVSQKKAIITYKPWRDIDQKIYISDIHKIKKITGWEPTISPKEGISLMYKTYQKI